MGDHKHTKIFEKVVSLSRNILQDAQMSQRSAKSDSKTERIPVTYSDINPLLFGNQHLALLYLARKAIWKKEAGIPSIYYTIHIYNMLRITGDFPFLFWQDAS